MLFSCQGESNVSHNYNITPEIKVLDNFISIDLNRNWSKDESFKIEEYCKRQGWDMIKTSSGIFYKIVRKGSGTIFPTIEDEITINYDIRLLDVDQTLCYSSNDLGIAVFKVEKSLVESGLHEVITYLQKGDSAIIVLPHFLAHGIGGNLEKIPPLSPVLYYLSILDVKD